MVALRRAAAGSEEGGRVPKELGKRDSGEERGVSNVNSSSLPPSLSPPSPNEPYVSSPNTYTSPFSETRH